MQRRHCSGESIFLVDAAMHFVFAEADDAEAASVFGSAADVIRELFLRFFSRKRGIVPRLLLFNIILYAAQILFERCHLSAEEGVYYYHYYHHCYY